MALAMVVMASKSVSLGFTRFEMVNNLGIIFLNFRFEFVREGL